MRFALLILVAVVASASTAAAAGPTELEGCNALLRRVQSEHESSRAAIGFSAGGPEDAAKRAREELLNQPPCDSVEARRSGRCRMVERGISAPEVGWDPPSAELGRGRHCAVVTVRSATWNDVLRESEAQERSVVELAGRLVERLDGGAVHLETTRWSDGRSAGVLGDLLDAQLRNSLAAVHGEASIIAAGVWQSGAAAVQLVLTRTGDRIVAGVSFREDLEAAPGTLTGMDFASDLFDLETGVQANPQDGLRPRLAASTNESPCEGSEEHHRVSFRGRGTVYVFSVAATTGETWLIERSDGPVDGEYVTPQPLRLVSVPGFEGGEYLVAAVVPEGSAAESWTAWVPTCVVPGRLDLASKATGGTEFFVGAPVRLRTSVQEGCPAAQLPSDEDRAQIAEAVAFLRLSACGQ